MGQDFYEDSTAAREIFDQAAQFYGDGFLDGIFDASNTTLNDTRNAQPALLVVEVAIAAHLASIGIVATGCVGHSLGEISALVVAGVCSFEGAMGLTRERARLMSEGVPEGSMAVVLGLTAAQIEVHLPESVQVANYNGPQQTIISGTKAGIAVVSRALKEAGARRVMPLKVSGAFHSTLMREAATRFKEALSQVDFQVPAIRFISSITGSCITDPDVIRSSLSEQLYSPVRWTEVMGVVGRVSALEVGPGSVLKGIARRCEGAPDVRLVGTMALVDGLSDISEGGKSLAQSRKAAKN